MVTKLVRGLGLGVLAWSLGVGCASAPKNPLDDYARDQQRKILEASVYDQGEFLYWAAAKEITLDDLQGLRAAWIQHAGAFPESAGVKEMEKELRTKGQAVVLVSLFMTYFENADLRKKELGWSVHPVPSKMTELSENDVVLRTIMPVKNAWARYFLLRYPSGIYRSEEGLTIGNRVATVHLRPVGFPSEKK